MHEVIPRVFLIGEAVVVPEGLDDYLDHIGVGPNSDDPWMTDDVTDNELLVEVMGRLCYRSWKPQMNKNVTKVREGNDTYLKNIIESRHGAVMEHTFTSWIFADVSRVFTHELVRHRVGIAFSQESLRYVRLTDLGLWLPSDVAAEPGLASLFRTTFRSLEELQLKMAEMLDLDNLPFSQKKTLTSAMRRIAPIGLATSIGCSMNFRTLRHLITLRTPNPHAEEEIRMVFNIVAAICQDRWPNAFGDFTQNEDGSWTTPNEKI